MTATDSDGARARRRPLIDRGELRRMSGPSSPLPHQPALDGLRAVAVAMVIAYHAGWAQMQGGFLGVEVFFVLSGYLITTLLRDERHAEGRTSLRRFWRRRARRLLPLLYLVLVAVAVAAPLMARDQVPALRRDLVYALAYLGNWGQIISHVPYFSTAEPLLRHVWSLAVEEQWYVVWPLAFVVLMRLLRSDTRRLAVTVGAAAVAVMAWTAITASVDRPRIALLGWRPDRFDFLYLNTLSRSSGLLLGSALALWWRPWERRPRLTGVAGVEPAGEAAVEAAVEAVEPVGGRLDSAGLLALAAIVFIAAGLGGASLIEPVLYRLYLPVTSFATAIVVAAAVDPSSVRLRRVLGVRPLEAIGRRSYGLYLWHWPVLVLSGALDHPVRLPVALAATVLLTEASYRLVELPVRRGALGRWWRARRVVTAGRRRGAWGLVVVALVACGALALTVVELARAPSGDAASGVLTRGGPAVDFVPPAAADAASSTTAVATSTSASPPSATAAPATTTTATAAASSTTTSPSRTSTTSTTAPAAAPLVTAAAAPVVTAAALPRGVVLLGDSEAHALSANRPRGISSTFTLADGSIDGCSIWSTGSVVTATRGFRRSFDDCVGWQDRWGRAVTRAKARLALVVIGAWDVFDRRVGDQLQVFGTPSADLEFSVTLRDGISRVVAAGARVALLEVPCMRPILATGAVVPPLAERADDSRVAHLNDLLRAVAAADPEHVTFVAGPREWCADRAIGTDPSMRWDGVHVTGRGAGLVFQTIAPALLAIPL